MNDTAKLGVALVGGYLLGRSKKAKTAVGLAMWLAGSRYNVRPRDLAREGVVRLAKSPQAARIGDEVRGPLLDASRRAARAAVEGQLGNISSALQRRTESLSAVGTEGGKAARKAKKGTGVVTGEGGEDDGAPESQEKPTGKREKAVPEQRSSGRRPAERTAAREPKSAPRGAKKAESRSKPAKSTASKGTSRSKAPAKKAASKSTASSRGRSASSGSTTSARGSRSTSRSR